MHVRHRREAATGNENDRLLFRVLLQLLERESVAFKMSHFESRGDEMLRVVVEKGEIALIEQVTRREPHTELIGSKRRATGDFPSNAPASLTIG